jgi:thiosulfate reductase cytochrome b subunit
LGITGLVQKFSAWPISEATIKFLGGIEMTRQIHHVNAAIMVILSAYHVVVVGYRVFVLRVRMSMLPTLTDFTEWWQDTTYKLGLGRTPAKFGRYNYGEKMEYWAMVWGTLVMGITGFMLWNPITTAQFVPGEWIPAAKAAHGAEAILAVLAIIIWHFTTCTSRCSTKPCSPASWTSTRWRTSTAVSWKPSLAARPAARLTRPCCAAAR